MALNHKLIMVACAVAAAAASAAAASPATERRAEAMEAARDAIEAAVDAAAAVEAPMRFNPDADAEADVNAAIAAAQTSGRHVMIVLGGDWCHDSMAIADLFAQDRFQTMLNARYEIAWVHVPFDPTARSIAVAHRFGLGDIVGTPTVLILTPAGQPINLDDAPTWRNAASRKPEAIYRHFARAVAPVAPPAAQE